MKRKILIFTVMALTLVCLLVVSASADTIYKKADGTELFRYTAGDNWVFTSYSGSFPKVDANGNPITWYITATETVDSNKVHTVDSKITLGEAGVIDEKGAYSFVSPVTNKNTVSVNFPDNAGIKTFKFSSFGGYGSHSNNNLLFAYCPNTITEFSIDTFQETDALVVELDDETPIKQIGYKMFHDARNIKVVNIPASVELIDSMDHRNGAPFCYTYSLKTITFAPNSQLKRILAFAFYESNIEEIRFPDSLVAVNQNLFRGCRNLKVIRFGANFQYFENVNRDGSVGTGHHSVTHTATGILEVYIPDTFYTSKPSVTHRTSYAFDGCSNAKFFFTGTREQLATSIGNSINSEWATEATDHNYFNDAYKNNKIVTWAEYSQNPNNYQGRYIIIEYNKCDAFYKGDHSLDALNDCTKDQACLRSCGFAIVSNFKETGHNVVETLVYAGGFGKAGVYSCVCKNAEYCTAIEGYVKDEETDPIITFKGYSIPEATPNVLAINVGYQIVPELLEKYERITGENVEISLFAVNSQMSVGESKVNISAIFNDNELNFAEGVKGFCVALKNPNYRSLSLTIRGFDKGNNYDGSYYTLRLLSAIAIQTTKDDVTNVHYVQAGLSAPETMTLHSFDFVIITASAVYRDPIPENQ